MLNYDKLILSSGAYNILSLDCRSKRLSHAYLFVSKDENLLKRFSESVAKLFINLEDKSNEEKNNLVIKGLSWLEHKKEEQKNRDLRKDRLLILNVLLLSMFTLFSSKFEFFCVSFQILMPTTTLL